MDDPYWEPPEPPIGMPPLCARAEAAKTRTSKAGAASPLRTAIAFRSLPMIRKSKRLPG
jgi:hypothetical protein